MFMKVENMSMIRDMEDRKKFQMKFPEMKNTMSEIKN